MQAKYDDGAGSACMACCRVWVRDVDGLRTMAAGWLKVDEGFM